MYDSDRGIEEMLTRLGEDPEGDDALTISVEWLADQMRTFVDLHPDWEDAIGRLASHIARTEITDD